ncbi:MAG: hypothetical protein WDN10_03230 [bacterium]
MSDEQEDVLGEETEAPKELDGDEGEDLGLDEVETVGEEDEEESF